MCDHGLLYRHVQHLQQRRPTWHCGTCGRVSYHPLDCCARPAFTPRVEPLSARLSRYWDRGVALWRRLDLPGLLHGSGWAVGTRRHQRAAEVQGYDLSTPPVTIEHDHAEATVVDYIPVGAGNRD
jgi:hypothetical protein